MKKIIVPSQKENLNFEKADGFLLGLKDYSANFIDTYTVEEIEEIKEKYPHKDIFVAVNKNILNEELPFLQKTLEKLDVLSLKGILFYDLALLHKKDSLKTPLYWAQEHFTTNYLTMEYYRKEGVKGTFVSSDITKEETLQIREKYEGEMIVPVFGYLPIFVSRRHLVNNYEKTFDVKGKGNVYAFEKEGLSYKIIDTKEGTMAFSAKILNGFSMYKELEEKRVEYALINGQFLKENILEEILNLLDTDLEESKIEEKVNDLCGGETDTGFLYKETFYKVKQVKE